MGLWHGEYVSALLETNSVVTLHLFESENIQTIHCSIPTELRHQIALERNGSFVLIALQY